MVTLTPIRSPAPAARAGRSAPLRHLGPHWYATVMGTAIVANAGAALPGHPSWLRLPCLVVWALSAALLAAVLTARVGHLLCHPDQARRHLLDPAVAPFYGCLSMALLAVGAGTLSVGADWIGVPAAVAVDAGLWLAGTASGLLVAVAIPYLMVARHRIAPNGVAPVLLLPVVAPMVSAATGPALVPQLPPGQWRAALLLGCYAMFGLSLLATLVMLPMVFARLVQQGPLPLALTPTLFLVLGPLGQSTTAVGNAADAAHAVGSTPYAHLLGGFAVLYGVPVMGFALLWLALAGAMVVRAARRGMPFAMTWWGFTFPVGTCVTGAASLSRHTGAEVLGWLAVGLYVLLVAAWGSTAVRTARGLVSGELLAAPRR